MEGPALEGLFFLHVAPLPRNSGSRGIAGGKVLFHGMRGRK